MPSKEQIDRFHSMLMRPKRGSLIKQAMTLYEHDQNAPQGQIPAPSNDHYEMLRSQSPEPKDETREIQNPGPPIPKAKPIQLQDTQYTTITTVANMIRDSKAVADGGGPVLFSEASANALRNIHGTADWQYVISALPEILCYDRLQKELDKNAASRDLESMLRVLVTELGEAVSEGRRLEERLHRSETQLGKTSDSRRMLYETLRSKYEFKLKSAEDEVNQMKETCHLSLTRTKEVERENSMLKDELAGKLEHKEGQIALLKSQIQSLASEQQVDQEQRAYIEKEALKKQIASLEEHRVMELTHRDQLMVEEQDRLRSDYEFHISKMASEHQAHLARLEAKKDEELAELHRNLKAQQVEQEQKASVERQELRKHIAAMQSKTDALLADVASQHKNELSRLEEEKDRELSALHSKMKASMRRQVAQIIAEKEDERQKRERDLAEMKSKHDDQVRSIQSRFSRQLSVIKHKHKEEVRIRDDALVSSIREEAPTYTAKENSRQSFESLSSEIDYLCRRDWTRNGTVLTENIIGMSKHARKTKLAFLKNMVWNVLYDAIFATPFRMLGREGIAWEKEWAREFNPTHDTNLAVGYIWPRASTKSELWRLNKLKPIYEGFSSQGDSVNARYPGRDEINDTITAAAKHISDLLLQVSEPNPGEYTAIREMVKAAAKIWLEYGTQHCRIRVTMNDGIASAGMAVAELQTRRSVQFVAIPGLRRIGDGPEDDFYSDNILVAEEVFVVELL